MNATEATTLVLTRTFAAPVARVWRAFTEPTELKKWYALNDEWTTPIAEVDLRVGGQYRLGLQPPGREPFFETGEYREIVENERLVYTCALTGDGDVGHDETLVVVEFKARGDETDVVITQGYATVADRDVHGRGWSMFLERLAHLVSTQA